MNHEDLGITEKQARILQKLLALAKRGVGGESDNAQAMLESKMRELGLSLVDLESEHRERVWFKYKRGAFSRDLLSQVIYSVMGDADVWRRRDKSQSLGCDVTNPERLEIELRYEAFFPALQSEFKSAYTAFLHVNKIFPGKEPEGDGKPLSNRELMKLVMMMEGMERVPLRRGIEGGGS